MANLVFLGLSREKRPSTVVSLLRFLGYMYKKELIELCGFILHEFYIKIARLLYMYVKM